MVEISATLEGPFDPTNLDMQSIIKKTVDKMAESLKAFVLLELERSVQLASYVGQNPDPEIIRMMVRSIKVNVIPKDPPEIEVQYKDDLSHWYGQGEMPEELYDMLNEMIGKAVEKWFKEQERKPVLEEVLRDNG